MAVKREFDSAILQIGKCVGAARIAEVHPDGHSGRAEAAVAWARAEEEHVLARGANASFQKRREDAGKPRAARKKEDARADLAFGTSVDGIHAAASGRRLHAFAEKFSSLADRFMH